RWRQHGRRRTSNSTCSRPPSLLQRSGHPRVLHSFPTRRSSDLESDETLGDLTGSGQRILVQAGARGGRGNARFASATNRAPRKADRKSTRLNSSHVATSYAVFCPFKLTAGTAPPPRPCELTCAH